MNTGTEEKHRGKIITREFQITLHNSDGLSRSLDKCGFVTYDPLETLKSIYSKDPSRGAYYFTEKNNNKYNDAAFERKGLGLHCDSRKDIARMVSNTLFFSLTDEFSKTLNYSGSFFIFFLLFSA